MKVPDLERNIRKWELHEMQWNSVPGIDRCTYCHQEKDSHSVITAPDGFELYICLHERSRHLVSGIVQSRNQP